MTRRLSDTLARMSAGQRAAAQPVIHGADTALGDLTGLKANPGGLAAKTYVPAGLGAGAALVVALHGCTQTAAGYDHGTGWSVLAEREGFALLLPEQTRANNANLCFNWFVPDDIGRVGGEAESIALMVRAMIDQHGLDPSRVYVTGLSAGGAMAAVMLATYPELFAGGAIIGGLPYGSATNVPEAFDRMRGHGGDGAALLAAAVRRAAGDHQGPWPTVSIWHGTSDSTVSVTNMDRIGQQWRGVHGIADDAGEAEQGPGWSHKSWRGADGRVAVEEWSIAGMGHGVPLDPSGADGLGASGPYMLDVGLSSTAAIAASWGLTSGRAVSQTVAGQIPTGQPQGSGAPSPETRPADRAPAPAPAPELSNQVRSVIEDALRGAGLMR